MGKSNSLSLVDTDHVLGAVWGQTSEIKILTLPRPFSLPASRAFH
jgi:hypothetical protein